MYATIQEEDILSSAPSSPSSSHHASLSEALPEESNAVHIVESDTESIFNPDEHTWDDTRGITALRKFYHLKDEAESTVNESRRVWADTASSLLAIQGESFGWSSAIQVLTPTSIQPSSERSWNQGVAGAVYEHLRASSCRAAAQTLAQDLSTFSLPSSTVYAKSGRAPSVRTAEQDH